MTVSNELRQVLIDSYRTILSANIAEHGRVQQVDRAIMNKVDQVLSLIGDICEEIGPRNENAKV